MTRQEFNNEFKLITGHLPFPWQVALYKRFTSSEKNNVPKSACLPTGLGKTNVIAVWLLARLARPDVMPRRLVYVVNRRTVVDQTTIEVQRLRENLPTLRHPRVQELAVSTLRGQFADNAEWSADPSRLAVICGTVDMIGSRLLFEGYRIGFKSRPLHAGFLGQDSLLVHDEAHLEPAFQKLIESIQEEQRRERERNGDLPWPGLRVMALSATARIDSGQADAENCQPFELTDQEKQPPDVIPEPLDEEPPIHRVWRRMTAKKTLFLHPCEDEKKALAVDVVDRALQHKESGNAVLVFLRTVEATMTAVASLEKELPAHVAALTGTMRGYERDELVKSNPVFARFMPRSDRPSKITTVEGTVYLVCTSAGEVGVNLSADHMVCDLSTFDSMAQRLGRVNRFGDRDDTRVDVVHPNPETFDEKHPLTPARKATLALLKHLNGDASPRALDALPAAERIAAFAPEPTILPATDVHFDRWALTTIQGKMPGRPPIAPYLHGVAGWEPRRTSVAWREEVQCTTDELIDREGADFLREMLADYPLKPHELLNDLTDRIYGSLQTLIAEPGKSVKGEKREAALQRARRNANARVWLIDESGSVTVIPLGKLLENDKKSVIERLGDGIVLLPPNVGGLSDGLLAPQSEQANDVADRWLDEDGRPRRQRRFSDDAQPMSGPEGMALIRTVDTNPLADEVATHDDLGELEVAGESESEPDNKSRSKHGRFWHWYTMPRYAEDATRASNTPITWGHHTRDVVSRATKLVETLDLPSELKQAVIVAAELHDLGKRRRIWQRSIGNPSPTDWYAKPGKSADGTRWRPRRLTDYRHEFGSLLDVLHADGDEVARFAELNDETQDVVLHVVAAHHGYARPHFPPTAYDHECYTMQQNQDAARELMRRYARLQRRFGRWGLAYLESLLRAADWAASAEPSPTLTADVAKA